MKLYKTEKKDGFIVYKYECTAIEAKNKAYQCILDNLDSAYLSNYYDDSNCDFYTYYTKYTWVYNPYDYVELITYEDKYHNSVFVDITDSITKERFYYNVIDIK